MKRQSGKPGQHFYHSLASDGILSIPAYRSKYFSDCCNLIHKQFFHAGYMICNENQIVELTEFSGFFLLILPIFWQEPTRKGWDYLGFQRWRKRHKEAKGFLKVGEKEEVGKIQNIHLSFLAVGYHGSLISFWTLPKWPSQSK